jgi:DNA sulfur modification protein DndD
MKIKKLEMKNWRGFYGSNHVIEFSTNKDKPITVLIGANETGKSDILRAIHWILFDEMPSDTSGPLDLINNYAEKEDKNAIAEATIELISNDKEHFKLTRKLDKDADKGGESTFVAQKRD